MTTFMRHARIILAAMVPIVGGAQDAPRPITVRFAVAHPEGGPWMPRVRVGSEGETRGGEVGVLWNARYRAQLDVVSRADRNPDDSFVEGSFGYRRLSSRIKVPDTVTPTTTIQPSFATIGVYGNARVESNQTLSEQLGTAQLQLLFTHLQWRGALLLVPQSIVSVGVTHSVRSDVRDALGIGSETGARFDGEFQWRVPLGVATGKARLDPIKVFAEARLFRVTGFDARIDSLGFDRGAYVAARVEIDGNVGGVYAQWSRGRLPSQPAMVGTWSVGLRK